MYPLLNDPKLDRSALLKGLGGRLRRGPSGPLLAALLIAACTLLGGGSRLYAAGYSYSHPDEEIAVAVMEHVLKTGDNDTNWARTDVSLSFRYNEYNFSSYYLFATYYERLVGHAAEDLQHPAYSPKWHLRHLSAFLGCLCILFAGVLGWRMAGHAGGVAAALLTACSPTLFQDSLYARPETFVTLLTLFMLLALSSRRLPHALILGIAGFLVGVLIACKVTFLLYFPFPLLVAPAFIAAAQTRGAPDRSLAPWVVSACVYFLAVGAGFALGAPYALKYPWEFLEGVGHLIKQYSGVNEASGDFIHVTGLRERLAYSLPYVVYTVGYPALLLALVGLVRIAKRKDLQTALILGGPLLTLLYFIQTQVFFERNFSQALPVLFVLVGMGAQTVLIPLQETGWRRSLAAAAMLVLIGAAPVLVTAKIIDPVLDGGYQRQINAETQVLSQGGSVEVFKLNGSFTDLPAMDAQLCGSYIYTSRYFNNDNQLENLQGLGYRVIGKVQSVFDDKSITTLQTYLAPTEIYMAPPKPASGDCRLSIAPLTAPQDGAIPVKMPLQLSGDWIPDPDRLADLAHPWSGALYASKQNGNAGTGTLVMGPFRACGDVVVPFISGMYQDGVSLRIDRHSPRGEERLFEGIPGAPLDGKWYQLTIHQAPHECGSYSITAVDAGKAYGDWLGVGTPVSVPAAGRE